MPGIEFFQDETDVVYRLDDGERRILSAGNRELVVPILVRMKSLYPWALEALQKEYGNLVGNQYNYEYRMVKRFVKCNFGRIDPVPDIDDMGDFHFEHVDCPLRGECMGEGVICHPEFNCTMSEREKEVMKLWIEGEPVGAIANTLRISPLTVKKHITNSYAKAKVNSASAFSVWALRNGVFS